MAGLWVWMISQPWHTSFPLGTVECCWHEIVVLCARKSPSANKAITREVYYLCLRSVNREKWKFSVPIRAWEIDITRKDQLSRNISSRYIRLSSLLPFFTTVSTRTVTRHRVRIPQQSTSYPQSGHLNRCCLFVQSHWPINVRPSISKTNFISFVFAVWIWIPTFKKTQTENVPKLRILLRTHLTWVYRSCPCYWRGPITIEEKNKQIKENKTWRRP